MSPDPIFLNRRAALKVALGAGAGAGAVLLGGPKLLGAAQVDDALAASACTLTPEQEEGPFFVALERIRSNIVETRKGVALDLRITIIDSSTCRPVQGAAIDIWHADAIGHYSDKSQEGTVGQTWLRGVQLTSASGVARFRTIYPGFYQGRTTHIHAKVHIGGSHTSSKYAGGHVSHNGQIFFPEPVSTRVYATSPYTKDPNRRTYRNSDHVYTGEHGSSSILRITGGSVATGLRGAITMAVNTQARR